MQIFQKLFYSTVTDILTHNIAPKEGLIALECKLSKVLGKKARNCIPCSISMPSIVRVDKANETDLATIHISWKESFSQKSSCTTNHYEAEVWQSNNFGTSNVKKYILQTSQLRNTSSKDSVTYYFDIIYNITEGGFIWEFYFRMRAVNNILQDATEWRVSKIYREKASVPPKIVRLNAQPLNNQEYKTLFEILWSCDVCHTSVQAEVQWSSDIHFQSDKTKSMFVHSYKPIKIWSRSSAIATVTYFRLRTLGSQWGEISIPWNTFQNCHINTEYFNITGHQSQWKCEPCPVGASCSGQGVTWKEVKALYGWWRNSVSPPDSPSNFSRCFIPSACLGAANPSLRQEDHVPGREDLAMIDHNETCNTELGYSNVCTRENYNRCRLCQTCKHGYSIGHMGNFFQCSKCPPLVVSSTLIVVGSVILVLIFFGIMYFHIEYGLDPAFTEARKLIILNYFQIGFVISKLDARWPSLLQLLFQVESAVGSLGFSLVSFPCHLNLRSMAEMAYLKQIIAIALPPGLFFLSYSVWRTSACFKRA